MTLPNTIHTVRKPPPNAKKPKRRTVQQQSFPPAHVDPIVKQQALAQIQSDLSAFRHSFLESLRVAAPPPITPIVHVKRAPSTPPAAPRKLPRIERNRAQSAVKPEPDSDDDELLQANEQKEEQVEEPMEEEDDEENNESDESTEKPKKKPTKSSKKKNKVVVGGIERRSKLPLAAVKQLESWFKAHVNHPYPTETEKNQLAKQTGLDKAQINNWFTNTRKRYWVPHIQSQQMEQSSQQSSPKKKSSKRKPQSHK